MRVEVFHQALQLLRQIIVKDLLSIVLRHNYLEDLVVFLVLDQNVSLRDVGLLVKHDKRRFDRLLESNISALERHGLVRPGLCQLVNSGLGRITADNRARPIDLVEELVNADELTCLLIKPHSSLLKVATVLGNTVPIA